MNTLVDLLNNSKIDYKKVIDDVFIIKNSEGLYDINFIITVKGRLSFAKPMYQSFSKAKNNSNLRINYTIVELSSNKEHYSFCLENNIDYIHINIDDEILFNKSLGFNIGALMGCETKSYIFHDIDCLIQSDFFDKLSDNIKNKTTSVIQPFNNRRLCYLNDELTNQIINNNLNIDELTINNKGISLGKTGAPGGSIYICVDLFNIIGGYDCEFFSGYSPEDIFFWNKIKLISDIPSCDNPPIELLHMSHKTMSNSNPFFNKMSKICNIFESLNFDDKMLYLNNKKDILNNFRDSIINNTFNYNVVNHGVVGIYGGVDYNSTFVDVKNITTNEDKKKNQNVTLSGNHIQYNNQSVLPKTINKTNKSTISRIIDNKHVKNLRRKNSR